MEKKRVMHNIKYINDFNKRNYDCVDGLGLEYISLRYLWNFVLPEDEEMNNEYDNEDLFDAWMKASEGEGE